ncbi:MAG: hypothetical protein J0M04_19835 [Verrucomicrobia bacterium]|nr:hypothetical protein [Verrucomicrobiota bacterium]
MSDNTKIQWAGTTVNPIMGSGNCELFPNPATVLANIREAMNQAGASPAVSKKPVQSVFRQLIDGCIRELENTNLRNPDHSADVTTTNIVQLRDSFVRQAEIKYGKPVADAAGAAIRTSVTCYASVLHIRSPFASVSRSRSRCSWAAMTSRAPERMHTAYSGFPPKPVWTWKTGAPVSSRSFEQVGAKQRGRCGKADFTECSSKCLNHVIVWWILCKISYTPQN